MRTWTKAEGLPDASVSVILQTRNGYLWVGTADGLARFDGVNFTYVPLPRETTGAEISITALCEDETGGLWIGSQKQGVFCWRNGHATHFGTNDGLLDLEITSLTVDKAGQVWIGTPRGVNRWDGQTLTALTSRDGLPDDSVLSVHAALSGAVWITTAGGMCRYIDGRIRRFHFPTVGPERDQEFLQAYEDRRGNLWAFCATYLINLAKGKRINYFPGEKSAVTRIWSLCEGHGGRLWIGANGRGVFCFDGTKFEPVTLNEGRWPNDVRTLCEDDEGNLWLGISGVGLVQLRPQNFALLKENPGLPSGASVCLMTNVHGQLYVGMDSGGVYGNFGDRFEEVPDETRCLGQGLISTICAGTDGSLWIGTTGNGLYQVKGGRTAVYTTADGLSDDCITALCVDGFGAVWIGTRSGVLHRFANGHLTTFTMEHRLAGASITALVSSHDGGFWVGTSNGELIRGDHDFRITAPVPVSAKLGGKAILSLCESSRHGVWIGTDGGGLGYADGEVNCGWNSHDGLPDNVITGMVEDSEGNLWLVTPKGLCRITGGSIKTEAVVSRLLKVKLVVETDPAPLRGLKVGGPRAVRTAQGRLWFALASGLVGVDIHTHGWETDNPVPQVHVEAMLVNYEPMDLTAARRGKAGTLRVPTNLRSLEFQFTALSFEAPEKVRFRHKLTGFDPDWVESGSKRSAKYGPLPSGSYDFHVTACSAEGVWNEKGASLPFVVPTPFWRVPWVLAVAGLAATAAGASTVRFVSHRRLRRRLAGLEQQQAMERERMRIAQNMHDEIGSKLTKISFLSERAKVELQGEGKVEGRIDSIASTSRELLKALDEIVWAVNPRNDTLEHLAAYLCQYAREYFQDTPVECDLHVQSELPQVEMSAETRHNLFLAFEESLNNILKHANATRLRVDISTAQEQLLIAIQDNGCGFEQVPKADGPRPNGMIGGNGLKNMRQRLADAGGTCSVRSCVGHGTTVTLSMSIQCVRIKTP